MFNFFKNIGATEIVILVLILVVLFGGGALAKAIARKSGETVKEAKKIKKEFVEAAGGSDNKPS